MESLTKNKQDKNVIKQMVEKAFPSTGCDKIEELKEGFFNVAYYITLTNGEHVILKVAPHPDARIMSNEKNIMFSEVDSLRLVKRETEVPIPDILYYDDSHEICPSDYFFMSVIEGGSFSTLGESLTEEDRKGIQKQIGEYNYSMNQITGERFGYYGQQDLQGDCWFEVFRDMLQLAFYDARKANIEIPYKEEEILSLLERDKSCFDEVTIPRFVHWDLWAGNVFVKDNMVTGVIDFERCIWGDPLLEVGFRCYERNVDFLEGYGLTSLTKEEERRANWYDIYLFQIMILEGEYRQYETDDAYNWAKEMLVKCVSAIDLLVN
ncbi:phosphotransferase family protein [Anaerosporobacter sp.]|uniref:phosphotransferase family protein n=1 Tax=Anaerosporobacter sp. TaxID=1872529 RepID=UPI00286FA63C|nr:aminoglycoside phosphotransferase family protein [Anaerosporobacter sp.]